MAQPGLLPVGWIVPCTGPRLWQIRETTKRSAASFTPLPSRLHDRIGTPGPVRAKEMAHRLSDKRAGSMRSVVSMSLLYILNRIEP